MNYLYVIHIPIALNSGNYYMPRAAALDLMAHKGLLPKHVRLILAAPVLPFKEAEKKEGPMDPVEGIDVRPLRYENTFTEGLYVFVQNLILLNRAVNDADLVHTGGGGFPFFFSPCYLALRIALRKNKPVLFVMDCDLVGKLETDQIPRANSSVKRLVWKAFARLSWRLYTECLRSATVTFLLGRGVVSRYGAYAHKPLEIYQPVIGPEWLIPEEALKEKIEEIKGGGPVSICFAGRLVPEKGLEVMIKAVSILKEKGTVVKVNVFGDGPQRADYEMLSKKDGLEKDIIFHGQKEWGEELFAEIRKNHIHVIPHLTLEMTRNVFDGMASGCALITSATEALGKLIEDSGAGICFATGSSEALAKAIHGMLDDRGMLIKYIAKGVKFAGENHRDAHVKRRLDYLAKEIPGFYPEDNK